MMRSDGRGAAALRPVGFERGYTGQTPGSVLIRAGRTRVLCTASWEKGVPKWREASGLGWLTAEYDMLPGSTRERRPRNRSKVDGRTQEIQRLIGRSLRAVVDFAAMGPNTLYLDCDVIEADGGTRTASITGAFVAMCDAMAWAAREGRLIGAPVREAVAAVSVGIVGGRAVLDLNYEEDVAAEVDMNLVMTESGRFVEVQGTGEGHTFGKEDLAAMLEVGGRGIRELIALQKTALESALGKV